MTIQFRPEQEQGIDQAIDAGLIDRADEVVDVGLETLRSRLEAQVGSGPSSRHEAVRRSRSSGKNTGSA